MKVLLVAFFAVIMIGGFVLIGTGRFSVVHASTTVNSSILTTDTTWTKANSPYNLAGPVGVAKGVTLTVDAGVTVNGAVIEMNGTLVARGSKANPIYFDGVNIMLRESSDSWNEQSGSGSIIENAFLSDTEIKINNTSPKINGNHITGSILVFYEGAPLISNNAIETNRYTAIQIDRGPTVVLNNTIITNQVNYGIIANGPSSLSLPTPMILNNTIMGSGGKIGVMAGTVRVSDNVISGYQTGIYASGPAIIERNLIVNNYMGIDDGWGGNVIRNNTIANNSFGFFSQGASASTINHNNFENNSEYNFKLYQKNDINATFNWWGTTDAVLISQKIFDNKNDYHSGAVNFLPFLTAPNLEAAPSSTPGSGSSTPEFPEFTPLVILTLALLAALAVAVAVHLKRKRSINR